MIRKRLTAFLIALTVITVNLPLVNANAAGFEKTDQTSKGLDLKTIKDEADKIYLENQKKSPETTNLYKDSGDNSLYKSSDTVRVIVTLKSEDGVTPYAKSQNNASIQKKTLDYLTSSKTKFKVKHQFTSDLNALSGDVKYGDIEALENLPTVESVRIAKEYTPSESSANALIQGQQVWEEHKYKGEGMVLAVLDTGFQVDHKDFVLSEEGEAAAKLTKENLAEKLASTDVDDVYYSSKFPTGYDWADMDNDISPVDPYYASHGMHVAGIVGANGDEENGGVKGIAPEIQIIGEKVFKDDGRGYEDDIVAGINHAVAMGADVINMSLGSDCGFVLEDQDLVQVAIKNAAEAGVLVVVSAGNATFSTADVYQQRQYPYKSNYDTGTVGDPSVTSYALSVASVNNTATAANIAELSNGSKIPYLNQVYTYPDVVKVLGDKEFDVVKLDKYSYNDIKDLDLKDKVVLIKAASSYEINPSLQSRFKNKGAVAILVANGYSYSYNSMSKSAPLLAISEADGDAITNALKDGAVKIKFTNNITYVDSIDDITMSSFSSWGTTASLDFKPEISGVGGNIYSSTPDNGHTYMSGTSMSSPQVAGAAAILLQSMKTKGMEQNFESIMEAKNILMNNTKVLKDIAVIDDESVVSSPQQVDAPYSPRQQGSGLLQLNNAINNSIIAYDANAEIQKRGAFALKEIGNSTKFTLGIEALKENPGDFNIFVDLYTDMSATTDIDLNLDGNPDFKKELSLLHNRKINGTEIKINGTALDTSNGYLLSSFNNKKTLDIELDLSKSDVSNNSFVEGYVRIVPKSTSASEINVPLMGFFGDWESGANIDEPMVDGEPFSEYTAVFAYDTDVPIGYNYGTREIDQDKVVFSPSAYGTTVGPRLTVLRNLEYIKVNVEDADGNVVRNMESYDFISKSTFYNRNIFLNLSDYDPWDGTDNEGNMLPDGTYYFAATSKFYSKDAEEQTTKLQVKLDNTAPRVSDLEINESGDGYEITFNAEDDVAGYNGSILFIDNEYIALQPGETSYYVDEKPEQVVVIAYDNAGNASLAVYGSNIVSQDILLIYFMAYGTNVNFENPIYISGAAQIPINWHLTISGPTGAELYDFDIEKESMLYAQFAPEQGEPNGTYILSGYIWDSSTNIKSYLNEYEFTLAGNETADKSVLYTDIMDAMSFVDTLVVGDEAGQYSEEVVNTFKDVIYNAETVYYEPSSTDTDINKALEDLKVGCEALLASVNPSEGKKSAINLLASCDELLSKVVIGTRPGNFPQEAVDTFKAEVAKLQALVNSTEEVSDEEFNAGIATLNEALLQFKNSEIQSGNTDEILSILQSQKAYMDSIEGGTCKDKYSESDFVAHKETLKFYTDAIAAPVTIEEAANLTKELKDKVADFLNKKINTTFLETAIAHGIEYLNSIDGEKNLYSKDAIDTLKAAITAGENLLKDLFTTAGAVNDSTLAINNAIKAVEESKSTEPTNPGDPTDPSDPTGPSDEIILKGIDLSMAKAEMSVGEVLNLTVNFTPADATNKDVTWESSNPSIAKVKEGKITALKSGTTIIKVTSKDGNFTDECTIVVKSKGIINLPQTGGDMNTMYMALLGITMAGAGTFFRKRNRN